MPEEGSVIENKNFHRQLDIPFVIYADFEAILENVSGGVQGDGESYTDNMGINMYVVMITSTASLWRCTAVGTL